MSNLAPFETINEADRRLIMAALHQAHFTDPSLYELARQQPWDSDASLGELHEAARAVVAALEELDDASV